MGGLLVTDAASPPWLSVTFAFELPSERRTAAQLGNSKLANEHVRDVYASSGVQTSLRGGGIDCR